MWLLGEVGDLYNLIVRVAKDVLENYGAVYLIHTNFHETNLAKLDILWLLLLIWHQSVLNKLFKACSSAPKIFLTDEKESC